MKLNSKQKKAFTLIELLIVIAIIGILFIVLVSKVDFATDKAKATGVQTDFRSFQLAFDTVAKENSGFNTFGWDEGDTNGDHIRNSYDEGDISKDGIMDPGEVWTGRKAYTETWTGVYTLIKPGTTNYDADAIFKLESAINKNLDPKLHITIGTDGIIAMANGAQDPWKTEYHGVYLTNATTDGQDRGAIVMYSNGANQEFGSEHSIANGIVTITVPGNNKLGADDYSFVSVYTYVNGYGEVKNITTGFSNNQTFSIGNGGNVGATGSDVNNGGTSLPIAKASLNDYTWNEIQKLVQANLSLNELENTYNITVGSTKQDGSYICYLVDINTNDYNGWAFMFDTNMQDSMFDVENPYYHSYAHSSLAPKVNNLVNQFSIELQNVIKDITLELDYYFFEEPGQPKYNIDYDCNIFVPSSKDLVDFDYFEDETNVYKTFGQIWTRTIHSVEYNAVCYNFQYNEYESNQPNRVDYTADVAAVFLIQ